MAAPAERMKMMRARRQRQGLRVDIRPVHPGVSRVWVERQRAIESRHRHRRLAGQVKQRPGSLPNRFGVIALGFERLSGQAAGFADVLIRQSSPPLIPLMRPTPADHGCGRRVRGIDRQCLTGKGDRLGKALFGKQVGLGQCAQIQIVSGEVPGRLSVGARDLGLAQLWFYRAGDIGRDLIFPVRAGTQGCDGAVAGSFICRARRLPCASR